MKQKEQLAAQEQKLEELTLKIKDVETLLDDVSDAAYDKAVEVVTDMEKSKQQKNKVRFVVVREFSGEKSMREAFEQLIERQTCEHFEEWRHRREMAENAA